MVPSMLPLLPPTNYLLFGSKNGTRHSLQLNLYTTKTWGPHGIMFVNKIIVGNEHTSVKLHHIEAPTFCQHLKVPTFKYLTCHWCEH